MLQRVVPWKDAEQEAKIRQWRTDLRWLNEHGYDEQSLLTQYGLTTRQCQFLQGIREIGDMPTDAVLLRKVYRSIKTRPSWLVSLEQFVAAAKKTVLVIRAEDLLQWTDEQLAAELKAGKILSFTDIGWGVNFFIVWDERTQAFYDLSSQAFYDLSSQGSAGSKPFASITSYLIFYLAKQLEIVEADKTPLLRLRDRFFSALRARAESSNEAKKEP